MSDLSEALRRLARAESRGEDWSYPEHLAWKAADRILELEANDEAALQTERRLHEEVVAERTLRLVAEAEVAEIRIANGRLESEIERLSVLCTERLDNWCAAEAKLQAVGELPERWRWEVELHITEVGVAVKQAVERRADELEALLKKDGA